MVITLPELFMSLFGLVDRWFGAVLGLTRQPLDEDEDITAKQNIRR